MILDRWDRWENRKPGAGSDWLPRTLRAQVYKRDRYDCIYCAGKRTVKPMLTIDHIYASVRGGADTNPKNLVTMCMTCNSQKSDRLLYGIDGYFYYLKHTLKLSAVEIKTIEKRLKLAVNRKLPKVTSALINDTQVIHYLFRQALELNAEVTASNTVLE